MKRILVTGVGAVIGYGILRSLRNSGKSFFLVGTDTNSDAAGQFWSDKFWVAPKTNDPLYLNWLCNLLIDEKIDLMIPGIEQDVDFLSQNNLSSGGYLGSIALNNKELIGIARDKWVFDLKLVKLKYRGRIESKLTGSFEFLKSEFGLPFLLKPRIGYASKGIVFVKSKEVFERYSKDLGAELFAQKYIGKDEKEYSVSAFGDGKGSVCAISALNRKLAPDGSTQKAVNCPISEFVDDIKQLSEWFRPLGPTNFQFRKDENGMLRLLEINPRISSSTSIRTAFNFNESLFSTDFYLDGQLPMQPEFKTGMVSRYLEEVIFSDRNHF